MKIITRCKNEIFSKEFAHKRGVGDPTDLAHGNPSAELWFYFRSMLWVTWRRDVRQMRRGSTSHRLSHVLSFGMCSRCAHACTKELADSLYILRGMITTLHSPKHRALCFQVVRRLAYLWSHICLPLERSFVFVFERAQVRRRLSLVSRLALLRTIFQAQVTIGPGVTGGQLSTFFDSKAR